MHDRADDQSILEPIEQEVAPADNRARMCLELIGGRPLAEAATYWGMVRWHRSALQPYRSDGGAVRLAARSRMTIRSES